MTARKWDVPAWRGTLDLTDVNPENQDHARDVILLVLESFNN